MALAWTFHLRWIFWGGAGLLGLAAVLVRFRGPGSERISKVYSRFERLSDRRFGTLIAVLCSGYFLMALLAKISQFRALALNAEDFWLFEDMLRQMAAGAPFLTRFAPQGLGWVQHGAVHPFFSWYFALPLSWIIGTVGACLTFAPLAIAGAGAMVAVLARPRAGAAAALTLTAAFLASSATGRILTYDVHPEAIYPLLVLLWAWAAGFGRARGQPARQNVPLLLLTTVLGFAVKEDSFLVFLPLSAWAIAVLPRRRWLVLCFILGLALASFQFYAPARFASGAWGPGTWNGETVLRPAGPPIFAGARGDSGASLVAGIRQKLDLSDGFSAAPPRVLRFLGSRPWLSLLALAPWLLAVPGFWFLTLPLCASYALLGGLPAKLMMYYVAPFLGLIWLAIAVPLGRTSRETRPLSARRSLWILFAALAFGSGGPELFLPTGATEIRQDTTKFASCLERIAGKGVASPVVLTALPERFRAERVWTDRVPASVEDWNRTAFILFTPEIDRYEMHRTEARALLERLRRDAGWERLGTDCRPPTAGAPEPTTLLFVRKGSKKIGWRAARDTSP